MSKAKARRMARRVIGTCSDYQDAWASATNADRRQNLLRLWFEGEYRRITSLLRYAGWNVDKIRSNASGGGRAWRFRPSRSPVADGCSTMDHVSGCGPEGRNHVW